MSEDSAVISDCREPSEGEGISMSSDTTSSHQGWLEGKLGDLVAKVIDNRGKNPPYVATGFEVIETGCISGNQKYPAYSLIKKYVDDETYLNWFRSGHPKKDDLLIITVGNGIGSVSIMQTDRGVLTQNLIGLRFNEISNSNFYYYYLNQESIQDFLRSLNIGSAQPSLKVPHLLNLEVPLPPLPEQKAIAAVLSSLDDKIDLLHRQNQTLEAMAATLFRQWFVEEAQEDWEEGVISDLISVLSGFPFKSTTFADSGKYRLITIKAVQDGYLELSNADQLSEIPPNMPDYCHLKNGDILLSLTGNVGRCCLVDHDDLLLNQRVAKLQPKQVRDCAFAYFLFRQTSMKRTLEELAKGTAQANLSPIETSTMEFVIPPKAMLEKYDECATPLLKKVLRNKAQIKSLENLRDTLLPKLMSGEVRVAT